MNRKESTTKVTTPKLRRRKWAVNWMTSDGSPFLCASMLERLWDIPMTAKYLWATASDRKSAESIGLWFVKRCGYVLWGKRPSQTCQFLLGGAETILDQHFDLSKPKKLWVTVEYE